MFAYMTNHPELLTADNNEGLKWAQTKNYAFLMESSSIEYLIERNCDVTQVGGLLDDKGYGIAMRKSKKKNSTPLVRPLRHNRAKNLSGANGLGVTFSQYKTIPHMLIQ